VRQHCSFGKEQESPLALLIVVQGDHLDAADRVTCL
jgi:hypothetical protein